MKTPPFGSGMYKLRLLKCGLSGTTFIAEFEVLESDNPAHLIGSKGAFFVKKAAHLGNKQARRAILAMMAALLGFDVTNQAHAEQINQQLKPVLRDLMVALGVNGTAVLSGRETVSFECRILPVWSPWTPVKIVASCA